MMEIGKIFFDKSDNLVGLIYTPSLNLDYYSYIKEQLNLGYHQVIITSQMMINIIEYLCLKRNFEITEVELLEQDANEQNIISKYLDLTKKNKLYFYKLIEELRFIKEESSIDIKKVSFIGNYNKENFRLFIQVNGIYKIDDKFFKYETQELTRILKRCINNG